MLPRTSALSDEEANRTTPVYFRQVTIVMLVIGIVVALLSKPVLLLFGPEFVRGRWALIILLTGVLFAGHNTLLTTHLLGRGKSQIAAIAAAVSLVTAVVLNLVLVPSLGLIGAAIATAGARGMVTITSLFYFRKISRGKISELFHFRRSDLVVFREILEWLKVNTRKMLSGR
jgi:O-antigen/teichoic acid export membrane protein